MTFCVTGNRPEKFPFNYNNGASIEMTAYNTCIKNVAFECLNSGYTRFITGMARGVDIDFADKIVELKNTFSQFEDVKTEAAIPYRAQSDHYDARSKRIYDRILRNCDKITYISEKYAADCFFRRNRYMIDNSDLVIAMWNEKEEGGTFYTINYAREKGKKIRLFSLKTMRENLQI